MSKWFQHDEHAAIAAAVDAYRVKLDGYQPTNDPAPSLDVQQKVAADAGEVLADRIDMALRSTDWRRVEAGGGR